MGPNVKKLIAHKMALDMIPVGTPPGEGLATGIAAIAKPGNVAAVCRAATEWVAGAIAIVKMAPDNPFKDDEEIAGEILRQIEERKATR